MALFDLLERSARRWPDHGAVYLGTERYATFAELRDRACRLGAALRRHAEPGSRILIAAKNCPEYIELLFGIWAAGMVAVPLNAKLHEREMAQMAQDAAPALVFASASIANRLGHLPEFGADMIVGIGSGRYRAMLRAEPRAPQAPRADDLAWIFYTSGTTGRSKGAMLSHRNLLAMTIAHWADIDPVDTRASLVHAAPMSHGSGLYILPYLGRGAAQILPRTSSYDPRAFLDLCDAHPGVRAFLAPTMIQRLCTAAEQRGRLPADLPLIIYGGGPMYLGDMKRALQIFGPIFAQIYGQGETPMTITGMGRGDHRTDDDGILGSVGWPRAGVDLAIVDEAGTRLPAGEIGEILCRGEAIMAGYWRNPAATREAIENGWLRTGDVGFMNESGYLTLRDRSRDLIISGGTNIYPREVEEALLIHPDVAEVAVIGKPDAEWGEVVVAVVAAKSRGALDAATLDAHCLKHIARFKRPKSYVFLDELPKSHYGKILKRELIARLFEATPADQPA